MVLPALKPALQYSEGRSKPWSGAKLINYFSERADGDKVKDFAVMLVPGLERFVQISATDKLRGIHQMGSTLYAVVGENLYAIARTGSYSIIGTIPGADRVRMQDNGSQLAICAAPYGFVLSDGVIVSPTDLPQVSDVAYIDSYFVWTICDSDQAIYSALGDGTSYDLLDIFSAEGSPDGLKGLINDHRELLMCGDVTIEVFYNAGGADDAFQRQGNAFIERGVFSRDTVVKIDNGVHFFGNDRIVYRLDGYSPIRISTHAIEYHLARVSDAWAFTYTQEGHKFYVLCTDQGTWAYDMATGAWHERRSYQMTNYRAGFAVIAWGEPLLGANDNGTLWRPNLELYTEDGEPIVSSVDLPTIERDRQLLTMYAFELYCETGVGLVSGQGSDPKVVMIYSDDGGRTWSNEMQRSLGTIGTYRHRALWRSLGQFRQRQIRLMISDPVRRLTMSYNADVR
jgi:hypothetical protein